MNVNEIVNVDGVEWRVVNIFDSNALAIRMKGQSIELKSFDAEKLDSMIRDGSATIERDPWAGVAFRTGNEAMVRKADEDYARIRQLIQNPEIYSDAGRRRLIREACAGRPEEMRRLKLILGTYWRRGQHRLSLMPDYGKVKGRAENGKKRGRKAADSESEGIAPTPELLAAMDEAARAYRDDPKALTLRGVHERLVRAWRERHPVHPEDEGDAESVGREEGDSSGVPTFNQFYYYYRTRYGTKASSNE